MKLYGKLLISMLVGGALALATLAFALHWRLGQGFIDYINAAEAERLPSLAQALAEHYHETGSWDTLRQQPRTWRSVMLRARELDEQQGETDETRFRLRIERKPDERGRRIGRDGPWAPLWSRLSVYDARRQLLIGRHPFEQSVRRLPIEIGGAPVGWIGLKEVAQVRSHVAEAFLADQRRGLVWASLAMALILGVSAAVLARAWTRPIKRIGGVTRRLAGGDFAARVGPAGGDEIGELARDIDFLARSLGEADAARKRWMADAAHELRTPLAVLKGELEALLDGIRPLDREAVASLHAEAQHLGALIEDLRQLALADVGALDYQIADVDLAELVRDCLEGNAGRLRQHAIALSAALPSQPVIVRGDARRLRQLVENLVENSLRYTEAGGRLDVALQVERDGVVLRFDDSAPGVPEAMRAALFEPFVRLDAARPRGGSGLGLAICRRIVDAHGGSIDADASPFGGLRIVVRLPLPADATS